MGSAVEKALDRLYAAKPEEFTALRAELVSEAKKDKDVEAAKRIGGCRKPTAAAWVVNALALASPAKDTLTELGSRLREAHEAMDGAAIRALTAEQRKLVEGLTRTALTQAGVDAPSAALRDDVTATLQAAVADPDVAARLGRLTKAEQWSGFGEFGFTAAVSTSSKRTPKAGATSDEKPKSKAGAQPDAKSGAKSDAKAGAKAEPKTAASRGKAPEPDATARARDRRQQQARATLAAAQRAKSDADAALSELQSDLSTARLRHQDAQRRLDDAEKALTAADDAYAAGKRAAKEAADAVKAARRALD